MSLTGFRDFTVPAGDERALNVAGDFITCLRASHAEFELGVDHESTGLYAQGLTYYPDRRFGLVRVRNLDSLVPLELDLLIGDGRIDDRRGIGADPEGVEPTTITEVAGVAFRTHHFFQGGGVPAGELGYLQLWNPAGSGVIAAIRQVYMHTNVAGRFAGFAHGTALTTLWKSNASCLLGDPIATGAVQLRQESSVGGVSPSGTDQTIFSVSLLANTTEHMEFKTPLLIPAGVGLVIGHNLAGPLEMSFGADVLEIPA